MKVQENLQKLLWNKRIIEIPEEINIPSEYRVLIFINPTLTDYNFYNFFREQQKRICVAQGVPSEEDLLKDAKEGGLFTDEDETLLANSQVEIDRLNEEILHCKLSVKKKQLQKQINQILNRLEELHNKRSNLLSNSYEYLISELSAEFLLRRICLFPDESRVWKSDEEYIIFKNLYHEANISLLRQLLNDTSITIKDIREVAHSTEWRLMWTLNRENLSQLFNIPIGDLNLNQKLLIYWSRIYDSAFESTEPPSVQIIEDDDLFDDWLLERRGMQREKTTKTSSHQERMVTLDGEHSEVCTCGIGNQNKVPLGLKQRHSDSCPFGTWREYSEEERQAVADKIFNKNTPAIQKHIHNEQTKVANAKLIPEERLRDRKTRLLLGMKTKTK